MKRFIIVFSVLIFSLASLAGNEGGHGGDPVYAFEFQTIGKIIGEELAKLPTNSLLQYKFTATEFIESVRSVLVVPAPKEDCYKDGTEFPALNFVNEPPMLSKIKVNKNRWREFSLFEKIKLVMHEYFGIIGVERDNYNVSTNFVEFIKAVEKRIKLDPSLQDLEINIFYGRCDEVIPVYGFGCDVGQDWVIRAEKCAKDRAESVCRIKGQKDNCQLIRTTYVQILNKEYLGLRHCEVETLMR